jgi:hypothetical protein
MATKMSVLARLKSNAQEELQRIKKWSSQSRFVGTKVAMRMSGGSCELPWRVSNPVGREHREVGCRRLAFNFSLPCDRNRRAKLAASIQFSLAFADFHALSFCFL